MDGERGILHHEREDHTIIFSSLEKTVWLGGPELEYADQFHEVPTKMTMDLTAAVLYCAARHGTGDLDSLYSATRLLDNALRARALR
jgi:hypothetical protein